MEKATPKFKILIGDITSDEILSDHDLIINPTNPAMLCGGGVSGAIFHKAGVDELERYTQEVFNIHYFDDNYKEENLMKVGEIRFTPGFNLGMDIMFVQGPKKYDFNENDQCFESPVCKIDQLMETYKKMLEAIKKRGYKKVLMPSIGTGSYGYSHEEVGQKVFIMLTKFSSENNIFVDLALQNSCDAQFYKPRKIR